MRFFKISSLLFFLALVRAWVKGGVITIWPVKPFENVMMIKGYKNKIEYAIGQGRRRLGVLQNKRNNGGGC